MSTFPGWHEEFDAELSEDINIRPFPSRTTSRVALVAQGSASLFFLAAALWQHVAAAASASMISTVAQDRLSGHVGPAATTLAWLTFVLAMVPFIGLAVMIASIHLLDLLTEN